MEPWLLLAGLAVLLLAAVDILWTTLWVEGGAGPLTRAWMRAVRSVSRRFLGRGPALVDSLVGPASLVVTVVVWLLLLWVGWSLLFLSDRTALEGPDGVPGVVATVYYAGNTLFVLGSGEIVPRTAGWQVASVLAPASGMLSVTLSITYLVRFLGAVVEERSMASHLLGITDDPVRLVAKAWRQDRFHGLETLLAALTPSLARVTQQHRVFPLLHHYHTVHQAYAPPRAVAVLDEALTVMQYGVREGARPAPVILAMARGAVAQYLTTLRPAFVRPAAEAPPLPDLGPLREAGVPTVDDAAFAAAVRGLAERRRWLRGLLEANGWAWLTVDDTA